MLLRAFVQPACHERRARKQGTYVLSTYVTLERAVADLMYERKTCWPCVLKNRLHQKEGEVICLNHWQACCAAGRVRTFPGRGR